MIGRDVPCIILLPGEISGRHPGDNLQRINDLLVENTA